MDDFAFWICWMTAILSEHSIPLFDSKNTLPKIFFEAAEFPDGKHDVVVVAKRNSPH